MSTIIKLSTYAANQKPWNIQKVLTKTLTHVLMMPNPRNYDKQVRHHLGWKHIFFVKPKNISFFFFVWKTHYKIDISWCVFLAKQGHKCILVSVDFNITNKKIGASHRGKCNSCKPLEVLKVVWWFLTLKYMNKTIS